MRAQGDTGVGPTFGQPFQLGDLRIDPLAGEVSGPGGHEKLDPKVMDVLVVLAQQAGQVVLREDLLARLWSNAVVTDDALSRCIYELRRLLSQAGGSERYKDMFETVPKRGYRLNGAVTFATVPPIDSTTEPRVDPPAAEPGADRPGQAKWRVAAWIGAAAVAVALLLVVRTRVVESPAVLQPKPVAVAANSIAVLPFVDMSTTQDQTFLADGVSEEILNRLAQGQGLRVIARTSSFAFRGKPTDIRDIASKLGVSHVLEGSLRRSGDRIRVTVQLIDATSNSHVWSDTYDRKLDDIFAVQDDIASSVAAALQTPLSVARQTKPPTANARAYERFLQGQFFFMRRSQGDVERAISSYEQATAIDPGFATAWAALSGVYALMSDENGPNAELWEERQGDAAKKAVQVDPKLAEAHYRLAVYYYGIAERDAAYRHHRQAALLQGAEPSSYVDPPVVPSRDIENGIRVARQQIADDPLSAVPHLNLGAFLLAAGRLDEASVEYRQAFDLSPDMVWQYKLDLINVLILQGRYDDAAVEIAKLPEGEPRDHGLSRLQQAPGRQSAADAALERLIGQQESVDQFRLAETLAFRGRSSDAFASLQRARAKLERARTAVPVRIRDFQHEMLLSPFLAALDDDPRWTDLMAPPAFRVSRDASGVGSAVQGT